MYKEHTEFEKNSLQCQISVCVCVCVCVCVFVCVYGVSGGGGGVRISGRDPTKVPSIDKLGGLIYPTNPTNIH